MQHNLQLPKTRLQCCCAESQSIEKLFFFSALDRGIWEDENLQSSIHIKSVTLSASREETGTKKKKKGKTVAYALDSQQYSLL